MATFPDVVHNGPNPTTPITVDAPAFDPDDTRSAAERIVDQQWRDVVALGLHQNHPLSLNRDTALTPSS